MEILTQVLDALSHQILQQIEEVSKCKEPAARKTQAEVVHLLTQSLSSIIDSTSMAAAGMEDFGDDELLGEDFFD